MQRPSLVPAAAAFALVGCSGGGGSPPSQPTPAPTHTATPSPTATPSNAAANGTVIDNNADTAIAGVTVAIAPDSSSASTSPTPVTTTAANGTFSFTTVPGSYLLVIGSNSPSDTRSTYHGKIALSAGTNSLTMGVPSPGPDVTLSPAQASGNYRLETLSSTQSSCLSGANAGRNADSLPLLVPDQSLLEFSDALGSEEVAQDTDEPSPLFSGSGAAGFEPSLGIGYATSANFNPCSQWTGPTYSYVSGNPPYEFATNPQNTLYGADLLDSASATGVGGTFGAQAWGKDPRPY